MEMKDKLEKLNHKRLSAIEVIYSCKCMNHFYDWIKVNDPLTRSHVYSLKRLAKEFLKEFPEYYSQYEDWTHNLQETIRIAKTPWLDED